MTPERRTSSARYGLTARTVTARYGVAAALALLAVAVGRVLMAPADGPQYALYVGAVGVAVWYGGFGPGLVTVVLSWSLSPLLMSQGGIVVEDSDAVRWVSSLVVALIVVWVSLVMRRGRQRAVTAAVEAEESTRQAASIQTLTSALSSALTPSDVANELVQRTPPLIGARGGALALVEGDEIVIVGPSGLARQTHRPGLRLPLTTQSADREGCGRGGGEARQRPRLVRAGLPGRGDAFSVRPGRRWPSR